MEWEWVGVLIVGVPVLTLVVGIALAIVVNPSPIRRAFGVLAVVVAVFELLGLAQVFGELCISFEGYVEEECEERAEVAIYGWIACALMALVGIVILIVAVVAHRHRAPTGRGSARLTRLNWRRAGGTHIRRQNDSGDEARGA